MLEKVRYIHWNFVVERDKIVNALCHCAVDLSGWRQRLEGGGGGGEGGEGRKGGGGGDSGVDNTDSDSEKESGKTGVPGDLPVPLVSFVDLQARGRRKWRKTMPLKSSLTLQA